MHLDPIDFESTTVRVLRGLFRFSGVATRWLIWCFESYEAVSCFVIRVDAATNSHFKTFASLA